MNSLEQLPADATLLPLSVGALLVSRAQATYCRIPPEEVAATGEALATRSLDGLSPGLRSALVEHGFFGAPREAARPNPSVQLQLTNACNLACSYCCTNSGAPRSLEVDRERFFAVVDEIRAALGEGARVGVLGGEPFLVPWAIDLCEHILDQGLQLSLFSNGLPLRDDDLARRVAALIARGAQVRISLAGPTRDSCDAASGRARFDEAVSALHNLARFGALPTVDLMLMPSEVDDVAETLPWLRKQLPPGTRIAFGVLYRGGREAGQHLFGSRAELETALDRIAFGAGEIIEAVRPSPVAERREGCTCALGHHLHVRSDGALFTCFKMEEQVGDLRAEAFGDAVHRVQAMPRPAVTLELCRDCALATLCGGGCRSENLQLTGDPERPACGPWRVRVLSELLAEDRASSLEWPAEHLLAEARRRGIPAPITLEPVIPSRHLIDT